jgi:hypothetical protein
MRSVSGTCTVPTLHCQSRQTVSSASHNRRLFRGDYREAARARLELPRGGCGARPPALRCPVISDPICSMPHEVLITLLPVMIFTDAEIAR